ncbi:uncharacterized protein M421DRAFT_421782 [Didymella exigua CBS 183.55]|uniref:SAP domain-containing protein n=1 Tax=Didymella exigua CBS 183.55 TaxID=1150837 RepID=A0A6A5RIG7_9PLEO|nr:uncharacterized protein M421DRAFT_421782 [Didymella exigua CBS 183.55]KAF1927379.1 hypothetical protein M421DRAFT_421782 [Didymella exigua CBS 183.55]
MLDYNKHTVAQLRQLLKDRGIPSTGLTRKAQIIEKLEEADGAGIDAPEASKATEDVAEQESEQAVEQGAQPGALHGPPLQENGSMFRESIEAHRGAEPRSEPKQIATETQAEAEHTPVPAPTADRSPETVSHIGSDVPLPNDTKIFEQPAEDTTAEEEIGGPQPTEVFSAAPTTLEDDQVGPHITEPTDEEVEVKAKGKKADIAQDELHEAPGPAAEALRLARPEQERLRDTQDTAMDIETPSPAPNERDTVEKPELLPIPERSTAETSRLNTEELEADTRKRKRRSNSPDLTTKEMLVKKPRPSQEPVSDVHLKEGDDVVMEQRRPDDSPSDSKRERKENLSRYKDLVQPSSNQPADALDDDRPTVPAIHTVTSALYIRNFMRPLRPEPLRTHLVSLASPPSSSPGTSIVSALFLDNMKTHALALFTSTTAASRVRASLHGSIWPPEGNRKELWVDFVPDDRVEEWIHIEEDALAAEKEARASGRPIATKRFEVVYNEGKDGIEAVHQEVGSSAPINAPRGPRGSLDDRRPSDIPAPLPIAPTEELKKETSASFKTLDELFDSTKAKPQLYYLPVSDSISEIRLKKFQLETSRDWNPEAVRKGRGMQKEPKYRYTFDDDDRIVEAGEDRGPWAEDLRGGRGVFRGRGGFRGGRGGGNWRG